MEVGVAVCEGKGSNNLDVRSNRDRTSIAQIVVRSTMDFIIDDIPDSLGGARGRRVIQGFTGTTRLRVQLTLDHGRIANHFRSGRTTFVRRLVGQTVRTGRG